MVWRALEAVDQYQHWWPWLRSFDARGLEAGDRWAVLIRVPLPWALHFRLDLRSVSAPERVDAVLSGDIEGEASVALARDGLGSTIRLQSALAPRHRLLRAVDRLMPSVSRRVHDRMVDDALRQFADRPRPGDGASHR